MNISKLRIAIVTLVLFLTPIMVTTVLDSKVEPIVTKVELSKSNINTKSPKVTKVVPKVTKVLKPKVSYRYSCEKVNDAVSYYGIEAVKQEAISKGVNKNQIESILNKCKQGK